MRVQFHYLFKIRFPSSLFKTRAESVHFLPDIKYKNQFRTLNTSDTSLDRSKTVKHYYNYWNKKFLNAGISEPTNSISYILAHIFKTENVSEVYKNFSKKLNSAEIQRINELCELRLKRMPIQYILGEWNFYGLVLKMQPPVFIPRPETEELVNIVLKHVQNVNKNINILEICCGSGAISLALLKSNLNIKVTAIDQSSEACELTTKNARMHQLDKRLNVIQYKVTNESRLQEIEDKFDVIVTNPPYVPSRQVLEVQPEIKLYEDHLALDGGTDGLSIIKPILKLASDKLFSGGKIFMETDSSHPLLIRELVENGNEFVLKYVETVKDFCKKDRFVILEKN